MQQQNYNQPQVIQEDEIDLKELFKTIWSRKFFMSIFTIVVTVCSIVYVLFIATPIYEAKAVIEIGYFNKDGKKELIDDTARLTQELNVIFIDSQKSSSLEKNASIDHISIVKNNKDFMEITANGISNESSVREIETAMSYIQDKHKKAIDERVKNIEIQIKNIDREIELTKTNRLQRLDEDIAMIKEYSIPLLDKKIEIVENDIKEYENQLKITNESIRKTQNTNPTLSALSIMDKRDLETRISSARIKILDMQKEKESIIKITMPQLLRDRDKILNIDLVQLQEKKELLSFSIEPHNYQNTEVVGEIMTNNYPIKPKKKLVVTVAFVTAFILAIFLVFFMEFVKGFKEEEDKNSSKIS